MEEETREVAEVISQTGDEVTGRQLSRLSFALSDIIIEDITSLTSLYSDDVVVDIDDDISAADFFSQHGDETDQGPPQREKSLGEKVGECCVGLFCTATVGLALLLCVVIIVVGTMKIVIAAVYWRQCAASPRLPVYLLVSGLGPTLFYVTCRTRKKEGNKVSENQRIEARWQMSLFQHTLDTQRAWQAGLAAVLCVFLLAWLLYGTTVVVKTMNHVENRPARCDLSKAMILHHKNETSYHSASSRLLSAAVNISRTSTTKPRDSMPSKPPVTTILSMSSSLSSTSVLSSKLSYPLLLDSVSPLPLTKQLDPNMVNGGNHIGQHSIVDVVEVNSTPIPMIHDPSKHDQSQQVGKTVNSIAADENNLAMTDLPSEWFWECDECDRHFVVWCFAFVLFDWAYLVALLVSLLVICFVPCCCFIGVDA